jgi:hypothetical protein
MIRKRKKWLIRELIQTIRQVEVAETLILMIFSTCSLEAKEVEVEVEILADLEASMEAMSDSSLDDNDSLVDYLRISFTKIKKLIYIKYMIITINNYIGNSIYV